MNCIPWPEDWPEYRNGGELCDMLIGHCSCGALHEPGEFVCIGGTLFRYNKIVPGNLIVPPKETLEGLLKQRNALDKKIKEVQTRNTMANAKCFTVRAIFGDGVAAIECHLTKRDEVEKLKAFLLELQ